MIGQPYISTPCPSCGGTTLFVGSGGHLTCSRIGCRQPGVERAIRELKRQSQLWQPIETAPRDGTVIEVYGEGFHRRCWGRAYYFRGVPGDGEGWITSSFFTSPEDDLRASFAPTFWRPLTEPSKGAHA